MLTVKVSLVGGLVLCCLCLLPAQQLFKKGSILTAEGKRLDGYLMQRHLLPDATVIYYKSSPSGKPVETFTPEQLHAYRISKDKFFVSAVVNRLNRLNLPANQTPSPVFLRQMNAGELCLFTLQTNQKENLYLQRHPGMYELLSLEQLPHAAIQPNTNYFFSLEGELLLRPNRGETVTDKRGNIYLYTDQMYRLEQKYISDLRQAFQACATIQVSPRVELERQEILELVERYNKCVAPAKYEPLNRKPWLQLSVIGYVRQNNTYFDTYGSLEYGLLLDIRENNRSPHVSLTVGKGWYSQSRQETEDFVEEATIAVTTGQVNYNFLAGRNIRPYLLVGLRYFQVDSIFYRNGIGGLTARNTYQNGFFENIGGGLNWYFLNFNHLRLEASYARAWELSAGYGLMLVK